MNGDALDPRIRLFLQVAAAVLAVLSLWYVRTILVPIVLSAVVVYVLFPLVTYLEGRGLGRVGAILIIYAGIAALLALVLVIFVPRLIQETNQIISDLPKYATYLLELARSLEAEFQRIEIPAQVRDVIEEMIVNSQKRLVEILKILLQRAADSLAGAFNMILVPVLSFYLLKDLESFRLGVMELLPANVREPVNEWLAEINVVLANYIRGQLTIAAIVGSTTALGLTLVGMRYALSVSFLTGVANLIPYLGSLISGAFALVLAAFQSPVMVLKVFLVYVVVQQMESSVLAPLVMQSSIGVHPFWLITAMLIAGKLFGFWGVLVAVPTTGALKVSVNYLRERR